MLTVADLAPVEVGANRTATVQEAPRATEAHPAAGVAVNWPGSAPVTVTSATFNGARPVLRTVMFGLPTSS